MILPSMEFPERCDDIIKDFGDMKFRKQSSRCYHDYVKYAKQKRSRVPFRHRKKTLMIFPKLYTITSPRKNRWMIVFRSAKNTIIINNVIRFETPRGLIACEIIHVPLDDGKDTVFLVEHTTHFFRRYFERHKLKGATLKKQVEHFFLHNPSLGLALYDEKEAVNLKKKVAQHYLDGIGLGTMHLDMIRLIRMNTYLPYTLAENGNYHQKRLATRFKKSVKDIDPNHRTVYNREYQKMLTDAWARKEKEEAAEGQQLADLSSQSVFDKLKWLIN